MWSSISTDEDKGVVTGVARVEVHPLASWVVSISFYLLSLGRGMSHLCWSGNMVKKGRWGSVNQSIAVLYVWFDDVGEYRDKAEVEKVIKGIISDGDWVCRLAAAAHNSDCWHKVVRPLFDDVE